MATHCKRLLALSLPLLLAVSCAVQHVPSPLPRRVSYAPPGYRLVWSDDFDGTALDTTKWSACTGARRQSEQTADAVSVKEGVLTLTTYTENGTHYTGVLSTKDKYEAQYGYFEARIRFQSSPGEWGAFWVHADTLGKPVGDPGKAGVEIDIIEHRAIDNRGRDVSNLAHHATHWDGYENGIHRSEYKQVPMPAGGASLEGNWHVYSMLWTPEGCRFFVDGVEHWQFDKAVSHRPQFILLSCEVEHLRWAGAVPEGGYGNRQDSRTKMDVDYVRVYQP